MSCYEWERGTIVLPSAEVSKVRKTLIETTNRVRDLVVEEVAKAHAAGKGTCSLKLYRERVTSYSTGYFAQASDSDRRFDRGSRFGVSSATEERRAARYIAQEVIIEMLHGGKVIKPTAAMIDRVFPRATNRTKVFLAVGENSFGEGTFTLEGRNLTWDVEENNHARDYANSTPLAGAVWTHLGRIAWTRGSGGQIVGNDEYNREADWEGGGGNYVTREFGVEASKREAEDRRLLAASRYSTIPARHW